MSTGLTPVRDWPWADGVTAEERVAPLPCDDLVPGARVVADRGVTVAAPADVTWRWLCQLRVAPYSYDLVDNLGRRSPRELTPGLDDLAVGQRLASVFRVASWARGDHVTAAAPAGRLLGAVAATWAVRPVDDTSCRLLMRMVVDTDRVRGAALAWGDLVMARRQLRVLAALAQGRPAQEG